MLGYLLVHLMDIVFLVGLMSYLVIWHLVDAYKLSIQSGLCKVKSRPLRRYGRNFRHVIKVRYPVASDHVLRIFYESACPSYLKLHSYTVV